MEKTGVAPEGLQELGLEKAKNISPARVLKKRAEEVIAQKMANDLKALNDFQAKIEAHLMKPDRGDQDLQRGWLGTWWFQERQASYDRPKGQIPPLKDLVAHLRAHDFIVRLKLKGWLLSQYRLEFYLTEEAAGEQVDQVLMPLEKLGRWIVGYRRALAARRSSKDEAALDTLRRQIKGQEKKLDSLKSARDKLLPGLQAARDKVERLLEAGELARGLEPECNLGDLPLEYAAAAEEVLRLQEPVDKAEKAVQKQEDNLARLRGQVEEIERLLKEKDAIEIEATTQNAAIEIEEEAANVIDRLAGEATEKRRVAKVSAEIAAVALSRVADDRYADHGYNAEAKRNFDDLLAARLVKKTEGLRTGDTRILA
jgi:hypothetical protein